MDHFFFIGVSTKIQQKRDYLRAYYLKNRVKALANRAIYRDQNREKCLRADRAYYASNREQRLANNRDYVEKNRSAVNRQKAAYAKNRRRSDPTFRLLQYSRTRVYLAVKGVKKSARTGQLLGCTISELRAHLESKFRPGMTWENYGPVWHVDHVRPCASFDLLDPAQQRECFHYTNLQPLFAEENLRKGAKEA